MAVPLLNDATAYGERFKDHLLDQYKMYVELMDKVSERRIHANNYLMTANAALVALLSMATAMPSVTKGAWVYAVPVAGIALCLAWVWILISYRNLNTAKFKVIHELEKALPAALYAREWGHAQKGRGRAYKPISHIEPIIPWLFVGLYLLLAIFAAAGCGPTICPDPTAR